MAKIRIVGSHDSYDGKYIENIDRINQKLSFTNRCSEAYERDGGFYVNSEIEYLKFHFSKEYPCLKYAKAEP